MSGAEVGELIAIWTALPILLFPPFLAIRLFFWGLRATAVTFERLINSA